MLVDLSLPDDEDEHGTYGGRPTAPIPASDRLLHLSAQKRLVGRCWKRTGLGYFFISFIFLCQYVDRQPPLDQTVR